MTVKSSKSLKKEVVVEAGAEKRLASILKKALNTPPKHVSAKRKKSPK